MNGRSLVVVAWAVGGLLFAVALTAGALALAGREIGAPAGPVLTVSPAASSEPRHEPSPSKPEGDRRDAGGVDQGGSPGPREGATTTPRSGAGGSGETPDRTSRDGTAREDPASSDD
jgi:hypothetical protein